MADDKTEEPTDQKLEKAHEEGQFPKSQEFTSALVFGAVLMTVVAGAALIFDQLRVLIRVGLDFHSAEMRAEELWVKVGVIYSVALWLLLPVTLIAAIAGTVGMMAQIGIQVSFKSLSPKFENISPAKGIKKMFSIKSVLELLQMMLRALIIGFVAWVLIKSAIALFGGAAYQTLPVIGETAWKLVLRLLESALMCFLVMSGADYAIQRWQFMKGQRMSKDEIKREYKESEGDPQIKSERMQLARENARNAPKKQASGMEHARVILTNPTHYAVALAYQPGVFDVPTVVARGADDDARHIRELGARLGIPIFSNPPLARALYKVPVSRAIPREYFGVVAAVLSWLQRIELLNYSQVGMPTGNAGDAS